jgi:GNAT superfamily N-acetyltransferase
MIDALQAYYATLYGQSDPSPVDPAEFSPPLGRFYIASATDGPVAMGGWRWLEPDVTTLEGPLRKPAEIKRMYVVPAARRQGHAVLMLDHLEHTAAAEGADALVLSTGPRQPDAIALYRSRGYVDVPGFGFFAAIPTAVHLGKRLNPRAARLQCH